jgi:hypothetical protein
MTKKMNIILISLLVINLLATGIIGYSYFSNLDDNNGVGVFTSNSTDIDIGNSGLNFAKGNKYTLYIGTNDKDTKKAIPIEKAKNIVNSICDKHVSGYSIFTGQGYWTNDLNQSEHENTLVYTFFDISEDQIKLILNETLKELNQESILVEKDGIYYTFYEN